MLKQTESPLPNEGEQVPYKQIEWLIPLELTAQDQLIVFSSCDSTYFKYAYSLIKSIDLFSPGFPLALHLINPSSEVLHQAQTLATCLNHTRLAVSIEKIDLSHVDEEANVLTMPAHVFLSLFVCLVNATKRRSSV
jgi:hypothetical protein